MPALGFFIAVAFWPGLLSAAVAPRWALIAVGLPLVSWLDPRALDLRIGLCLLATLGLAALSLAWTPDPLTGSLELSHLLILCAAVLAGACCTDLAPVLRAVALGVGVSSLIAVAQLVGHSPVEQMVSPAGLFANRNVLGELAAVVMVWAVLSGERWVSLVLLAAVILCRSRVGLVSAVLALCWARPRWTPSIVIMGVIYVLLAPLVGMSPLDPGKLVSAAERLEIWTAAISDPRLFGHGIGSFTAAYPGWEYAHSDFLQAFYELGVGVVPFALVVVAALLAGPRSPERAAFGVLAVECLISFPLHLPTSAFLAGLLVGHLAGAWDGISLVRPFRGVGVVAGV
jgi:hypothetical protein